LLFAPDARPKIADIRQLLRAHAHGPFAISHESAAHEGWLELLASGLTFDLAGLAGAPCELLGESPDERCAYGFASSPPAAPLAQVRLVPGAHLAGSENLLPVVRTMALIAKFLIALPGAKAILWNPAQVVMERDYFSRVIGQWLDGGVFPVLGLTAILRDNSGCIRSRGLGFFTGHEIKIEPASEQTLNLAGKLAIRLVHMLIEHGLNEDTVVDLPDEIVGVQGERWSLERSGDGRLLRVWQKS